MNDIALTFRSISPLVMHSARLGDPLDPVAVALKGYHKKAELASGDHQEIANLEFFGGLWVQGQHPCVPARSIEAALHEAGRRRAIDERTIKAIIVESDCALVYPGPQTIRALMSDPAFRLRAPVTIDGKRQMRTRPIFNDWSITAFIRYDATRIGRDVVIDLAIIAGESVGIGAGRPRHGRFTVTPAPVPTG